MALIPPNCVGIIPEANSGALLQNTPPAGVLAGTRLVPWISIQPFGAIALGPHAVLTAVMTGVPAAGCVTVPLMVSWLLSEESVTVAVPLAPLKAPVPPVIVPGPVGTNVGPLKVAKILKLSLLLSEMVAVSWRTSLSPPRS